MKKINAGDLFGEIFCLTVTLAMATGSVAQALGYDG